MECYYNLTQEQLLLLEVLLIDDHPMLSAGIISVLEQTGIFKCAQARSLNEAMNLINNAQTLPSIIILDLLLGEENGLDFLTLLKNFCQCREVPKPPVLVCSALGESFKIQTAINLGAAGFLSKTSGKEELLKAIDMILCGGVYIPADLNIKLKKSSSTYAKFSKREIDVLMLIKENKSNKQIADALYISLRTVENYISKIYFKTGFSSRGELYKL